MKELLPVSYIDGLRALVIELGGDFEALLAEMGLDDLRKADGDRYVSHRKLIDLTNLAASRLKRPDLGLMWGPRTNPLLLGPLGVAMMNAPTPRRAVELLVQYLPRQNQVLRAGLAPLERRGLELFSLFNHMKRPPNLVHVKERNIGLLLGILRTHLGARFMPREIWLSHPQNAGDDAYRRAYGMMPRFRMDVCGFVLKRTDLDSSVPGHRRQVFEMAMAYLEKLKTRPRAEVDILTTASAVLATNRTYSIVELAGVMGVHVRKLQRRLRDADVTFSTLKDNSRRDEAERLLLDDRRPLIEIALQLGFKDHAAFTRASRRWFGAPPSVARKALVARPVEKSAEARSQRTNSLLFARRMRTRPEGV